MWMFTLRISGGTLSAFQCFGSPDAACTTFETICRKIKPFVRGLSLFKFNLNRIYFKPPKKIFCRRYNHIGKDESLPEGLGLIGRIIRVLQIYAKIGTGTGGC